MKPVTKKILEAGLLDKHTVAMFERWKTIDHDNYEKGTSSTSVQAYEQKKFETREQLEKFAEEIGELLEAKDSVTFETALDLPLVERHFFYDYKTKARFTGYIDKLSRLVIPPAIKVIRGQFLMDLSTSVKYQVLEVEDLHKNDQLQARLVTGEICK